MIEFTKTYEDIGVNAPLWHNLHELVGRCSSENHLRSVRVINDIPGDIEMFADPLIEKVFSNLMENAIRHGGRTDAIRFYIEEGDSGRSVICEDNGYGMTEEVRANLFTKGYGKDHGLGLFLSREILAITKITITEVGGQGTGAKFRLSIPSDGFRRTSPTS
jgi:signal transduction histidine kinase